MPLQSYISAFRRRVGDGRYAALTYAARKSKPLHHCLSQARAAPAGEGKGIRQYRPNFPF